MALRIRVGSWVRLKQRVRNGPQKARVVDERPGIARGAVYLSVPLDGLRWWNKSELVRCDPPKGRKRGNGLLG